MRTIGLWVNVGSWHHKNLILLLLQAIHYITRSLLLDITHHSVTWVNSFHKAYFALDSKLNQVVFWGSAVCLVRHTTENATLRWEHFARHCQEAFGLCLSWLSCCDSYVIFSCCIHQKFVSTLLSLSFYYVICFHSLIIIPKGHCRCPFTPRSEVPMREQGPQGTES